VATDLSRGPWSPNALHGGPVGALLAGAVETADSGGSDFHVTRLTVELERPAPPHQPLMVNTVITRPGRKVQLVEATLTLNGGVIARARALRIRRAVVAMPDEPLLVAESAPPNIGGIVHWARTGEHLGFHNEACQHRFVEGMWGEPGPVTVWIRVAVPMVDDVPLTPLQRVVAAADFGNGVSAVLPWEQYSFINPELTVHQHRSLQGEWVGMRAKSHIGPDGIGFAESELFDDAGRLGRSVQSLLIERTG
jgi:Thioesterase-like superfamily